MYKFIDVDHEPENSYSTEAVYFGGTWLDKLPGYKTLNVSGRELYSKNIQTVSVGNMLQFKRTTLPARTIKIKYQLLADDPEQFRERYETLCSAVVGKEEEVLAFADDVDNMFYATLTGASAVEPGVNNVVGEMTFTCTDPHKYASTYKKFNKITSGPDKDKIIISNRGNVPVPIRFTAKMNGTDNGYIGYASDDGMLQYGDSKAQDANEDRSVMLAQYSNASQLRAGVTDSNLLALSEFRKSNNFAVSSYGMGGNNYGAEVGWHGYVASKTFTASKNVYIASTVTYEATSTSTYGILAISVGNSSGNIADIWLVKDDYSSGAKAWAYVKNERKKIIPFNVVGGNLPFGRSNNKQISIWKLGEMLIFNIAGTTYSISVPSIKDVTLDRLTLYSTQWFSYPAIQYMAFRDLTIRQDQTASMNVPNRFKDGDVLVSDGEYGRFLVNGRPSASDEVIGSTYFKAGVGKTIVEVSKSTWADDIEVYAEIREAWL